MKKQASIIMLLLFTVFVGFGIIIPILPEVVEREGNANFHLALLLSLYSVASFVMSPFWGGLSDRIGRKPVIMLGLVGFALSFALFGLAGDNLALMYISRIIGGLFSGAVTSCAVAYMADITTEDTRTKGMGLVGMSIGLGFVVGPALGGLLSLINLSVPFFASSLLSLIGLLLVALRLPESLKPQGRTQRRGRVWTREAFAGRMKYLYALSFFVTFTLAGLETTFQLFQIKKIGATSFQIGMMFLLSGIVGAAIQGGVVRKWISAGREKYAVVGGLLLSAAGFFLILYSTNAVTAAIYMTIFGAGNALVRPCVTSLVTTRTTVGQGVASGLNSSMDSLGRIVGPILAMTAYSFDISLPFLFGGVLSIAAIGLLLRFEALDRAVRLRANESAAP